MFRRSLVFILIVGLLIVFTSQIAFTMGESPSETSGSKPDWVWQYNKAPDAQYEYYVGSFRGRDMDEAREQAWRNGLAQFLKSLNVEVATDVSSERITTRTDQDMNTRERTVRFFLSKTREVALSGVLQKDTYSETYQQEHAREYKVFCLIAVPRSERYRIEAEWQRQANVAAGALQNGLQLYRQGYRYRAYRKLDEGTKTFKELPGTYSGQNIEAIQQANSALSELRKLAVVVSNDRNNVFHDTFSRTFTAAGYALVTDPAQALFVIDITISAPQDLAPLATPGMEDFSRLSVQVSARVRAPDGTVKDTVTAKATGMHLVRELAVRDALEKAAQQVSEALQGVL